ncbi:MAG: NAD(P)-dependent dehydrogenase (short-subunit alcohol dehydrogenase family) [Granulosicoccus sp.]|jgi:NAD(P)-dependent dehydrogenase (short-subunit alcohol dehydrogenase family)
MTTSKHTAIVTGGGRGIGLAIVKRLLDDGFGVLACGLSERPDQFPDAAKWVKQTCLTSAM